MHEKDLSTNPDDKKPIPQPADDGFPGNDDVSTPPPGSDQAEAE